MKLIFNRLELNNYRYYYGEHDLIFSDSPEKNVIVVKGDNGAGKSNILNALTWCLYDDEVHTDKKSSGLPIMNTSYIADLAESGKEGEASVTLTITVDGEMWEIKRTIRGYGEKAKEWTKDDPKYNFHESFRGLRVTYPVGNDLKNESDKIAQVRINDLLPFDLRSFFFIDGEQLREFFKIDTTYKLQDAIEKLSQLDLIKNAEESLKTYRNYLRGMIKFSVPALADIQSKISEMERNKDKFKKDSDNLKCKNKALIEERDKLNSYLDSYNLGSISLLNKEITRLEKSIREEKEKIIRETCDKNKYLISSAYRIYLKDTIIEAHETIGKLIERGDLPPRIKESFIHELLEKGVCVCGTPITEESKKTLIEYAEKIQISELTNIAYEGKNELERHLDYIREFPDKIDEYNNKISEYESNVRIWENDVEDKKEEMEGHNIEEVNLKKAKCDELNYEINDNKIRIRLADRKFEDANRDLKELSKQENTEREKSKVHSVHLKKLDAVNEALSILEKVESVVKEKIRKSLEENTKKHFLSFLREDGLFRDVTINNSYEVSVINNQGWDNLGSLSAGQYLILGYAFVVALRTITGYQAPVIVDTPLGKLDPTHQDKITSNLPMLLNNSQLVFLVTSSEYTETVKKNFAKYMTPNSYYEIEKCPNITSARLICNGE